VLPLSQPLKISNRNQLTSYLPVRKKGNDFSWETVTGIVLGHLLCKDLGDYSMEQFQSDCEQRFGVLLDDSSNWSLLQSMYFDGKGAHQISPLLLLFRNSKQGNANEDNAANRRMGELFAALYGDFKFSTEPQNQLNFLEQQLITVLRAKLCESASRAPAKELPYLPFLAEAFRDDLTFLADHPKYLTSELTNVLKQYAFAFCSQLALSVTRWAEGTPEAKPLYFILDIEKSSSERAKPRDLGYKFLSAQAQWLFPLLSASEALQTAAPVLPLWQLYSEVSSVASEEVLTTLNEYNKGFAADRELEFAGPQEDVRSAFSMTMALAKAQFSKGKGERHSVNQNYVRDLERKIFGDFVKSRGRAGNVLELNQDQLLLLTNLAVGKHEKLRFLELVKQFERRGFYFDLQSQQVLIEFYERMGNVDRMSDSGEAVYVRKTI
jgi:DNA phosphorothioation-dependent restriction protein DptG